jgi:hypothetical protein
MSNFKTTAILLTGFLLCGACAAAAQPAAQQPAPPVAEDASLDPFIAASLGAIPFVSGLYLSDRPARGIMFTAIDILMVMGIYTARNTASGDPRNVKSYFVLMGANNILDALLSARYARSSAVPRLTLFPTEGEGMAGELHWKF